jgi:hypothetical protein
MARMGLRVVWPKFCSNKLGSLHQRSSVALDNSVGQNLVFESPFSSLLRSCIPY